MQDIEIYIRVTLFPHFCMLFCTCNENMKQEFETLRVPLQDTLPYHNADIIGYTNLPMDRVKHVVIKFTSFPAVA